MEITEKLGQEIIGRVAEYVDVSINIMNLAGEIVASTDRHRVGEIHHGAKDVIHKQDSMIITEDNMHLYAGTKPGVNLPIVHRGKITGVVGVSGNPDDFLKVTQLVKASVEMAMDQIYFQRKIFNKNMQWSYWLQQLFHPSGYDKQVLEEEAVYSLKADLAAEWRVLVIKDFQAREKMEDIKRKLSYAYITPLFLHSISKEEVVLAIDVNQYNVEYTAKQIIVMMPHKIRIGIGDPHFGLEGIRQSYMEAKQVLSFSEDDEGISFSENWKLTRLISTISKKEFETICADYEHRLHTLGEEYLLTMNVYLQLDCSIKKTADALHIHRNTLLYRLNQMKDKVGLDPRSFHDAFLLKVIQSYPK